MRAGYAFAVAGAAIWAIALHMMLLASSGPIERRIAIRARGWPAAAPPMRLILLSDLHTSYPGNSATRLRRTIAEVNALKPDLVLIAGDFLSTGTIGVHSADLDAATTPLAALRARSGVVAVLGNHDQAASARLTARLAGAGVVTLDNDAVRRGPLTVIGLGDATTGHLDIRKALLAYARIGGWPVVLSHTPYVVWQWPGSGGLLLAGHTHCGQISLPLLGVLLTPRNLRRYDCGMVQDGGRLTIVSGGLGVSILPLRLGTPPDDWVIDIGPGFGAGGMQRDAPSLRG